MTTIDRALMSTLMAELNAAAQAIAQKHGILINTGGASWGRDGTLGTIKMEIAAGAPGDASNAREAKQMSSLELVKARYPDIDFDATYLYKGNKAKIIGYNPKARSMPFILKIEGHDRNFKFDKLSILDLRKA